MAIQTINTSTDTLGDACSVVNNNAGEQVVSASSNGSTLTLTKSNAGTITASLGVVKASGTGSIAGTQLDVFTSLAQVGAKILCTITNVTAGTPGALYVIAYDPGVSFTIESSSSFTGSITWAIIA